jgi:hypothetical protein
MNHLIFSTLGKVYYRNGYFIVQHGLKPGSVIPVKMSQDDGVRSKPVPAEKTAEDPIGISCIHDVDRILIPYYCSVRVADTELDVFSFTVRE